MFLDAEDLGALRRIGTLYRHDVRTALPASFAYDEAWLTDRSAFMLDPRLELFGGEQHARTGTPGFGVLLDSAPDRWGRVLMERKEAMLARQEDRRPRMLSELDFLLGVHDVTRIGALRFRSAAGGQFLDDGPFPAPPFTNLRELAAVSRRLEEPGVEELPEYEQWLAMVLAPGTSLGGARPKANFSDDERLWIAKFPAMDDRHDVGAWEFLVHQLADRAGITTPPSRLERLTERHGTFCVARFDRTPSGARRMFASASTLLERNNSDRASYLDLAEFISDQGARNAIDRDLEQLFRRVVFNVLVGNRDDHLRNHAFVRSATGWQLSPAFDMNPNPYREMHVLTLDGTSALPDVNNVVATGELYRLSARRIDHLLDEVRTAVAEWNALAVRIGIPTNEIDRMRTVFQ